MGLVFSRVGRVFGLVVVDGVVGVGLPSESRFFDVVFFADFFNDFFPLFFTIDFFAVFFAAFLAFVTTRLFFFARFFDAAALVSRARCGLRPFFVFRFLMVLLFANATTVSFISQLLNQDCRVMTN